MAKKRGLGKALDALLVGSYSDTATANFSEESLHQLPVHLVQRGKYQPRRELNPESLEDLANSIRAQGIIQPIVVRQLADTDRYEIIAGERRWRAAQLVGLTEVPALVRNIPDEAAVAVALIENIQREELNPVEEAIALSRLLDEFDMTHQQVAEAIGKSRATVTNLLRLLSLSEEAKIMLERGDLEMGHARALLTLSEKDQRHAALTIAEKNLSVRETEALVRRMQAPKNTSEPNKPLDPDVKRLQQDLQHRLGATVIIQHNAKGRGKLVIRYKNLHELEKILTHLR